MNADPWIGLVSERGADRRAIERSRGIGRKQIVEIVVEDVSEGVKGERYRKPRQWK